MKIVALVTCRGNNTFKNKHLKQVMGKKLIEYPLSAVKSCKIFDKLYISTDDDNILTIAKKYEFNLIKRPEEISRPDSQHVDAIKHALKTIEKNEGYIPDILVVVLGNTVYIKKEWIEESIKEITNNTKISAVVPVYLEQDYHPYRAKYMNSEGFLETYFEAKGNKISTNRQDLPKNYFLCHNFWTLNVKEKEEEGQLPWKFMGKNIKPLILDRHLDVHNEEDLKLCEEWVQKANIEGK